MEDVADDATDSDDLDIAKAVRKDLGHDDSLRESSSLRRNDHSTNVVEDGGASSGSDFADNNDEDAQGTPRSPRGHASRPGGAKVQWSEDDDEAYDRFQKRKSIKRKRAAASTRRAKALDQKGDISKGVRQKRLKLDGIDAGDRKADEKKKEMQHWEKESDDDQLMEYTLPDYLQKRRAKFDERYQKMAELGLRVPPRYEDVSFSDDENLEDLVERPDFPKGKPAAPYRDKHLPKSLGIIPAAISQWLRGYQVDGTAFLHALFVYQTGGVLGDDMGLGKTVQVWKSRIVLLNLLVRTISKDCVGDCILNGSVWENRG